MPLEDVRALVRHLRRHAGDLVIDAGRIGLLASSGNVPVALSMLMEEPHRSVRCAALCYGYMLDLDGATGVADAARTFGFANPCAGRSVDHLPQETALFVTRAGRDQMPRLNESVDAFVERALARNLPLTFVNHAAGPHAFDLFDDSATTRSLISSILSFLRVQLLDCAGHPLSGEVS